MPIHNSDVAEIFNKMADLLDIEGANQFRVRAYRNAARIVSGLPHSVSDMVKGEHDLSKLPGIGKNLAGKIKEIVERGTLEQLKELEARTSPELSKLMKVEGLGPKRVKALHEKLGITLLKAIEVDILKDGSLDLPDDILKELDLAVCAVHYDTKLPRNKQMDRIIRAMDNPCFTILAHPTGRLINEREPYDVDLEKVMEAALERGRFLELNAHPDRLDLADGNCKMAKEMGLKLAISTDAHRITNLDYMRFGVNQGRRGWLEPGDVINTRGLKELKKLLRKNNHYSMTYGTC